LVGVNAKLGGESQRPGESNVVHQGIMIVNGRSDAGDRSGKAGATRRQRDLAGRHQQPLLILTEAEVHGKIERPEGETLDSHRLGNDVNCAEAQRALNQRHQHRLFAERGEDIRQ